MEGFVDVLKAVAPLLVSALALLLSNRWAAQNARALEGRKAGHGRELEALRTSHAHELEKVKAAFAHQFQHEKAHLDSAVAVTKARFEVESKVVADIWKDVHRAMKRRSVDGVRMQIPEAVRK